MRKITIIEGCSLFIALMAMIATFWQANISEEHNRRSVIPYLVVDKPIYKEDGSFSLSIKNDGLGPAIITGVDFHINEKLLTLFSEIEWQKVDEVIKSELGHSMTEYPVMFHGMKGKLVIPPNEKFELFSIDKKYVDEATVNYAMELYDFLKPSFCYRSIYGDLFFLKSADVKVKDGSCNLKGSLEVFGTHIRPKAPWSKVLSSSDVFGD